MKAETRTEKIALAYVTHQEALARFALVRTLSGPSGNIDATPNVLQWAIAEMNATGLVLAHLRARALGYKDMRSISGSGTLAHLSPEEFQSRLDQQTHPLTPTADSPSL